MGADKLLGNGDMLFLRPGTSSLIRGQGTYLSDDEIGKVIEAVATTEPQFVRELVQLKTDDEAADTPTLSKRDDLYEGAVDIVVREGRGSVSLLQRSLGIGYGRAARLIDYMEEDGIVGPYNGSQAREILMTVEDWEGMRGGGPPALTSPSSKPKPSRASKITIATPTPDPLEAEDEKRVEGDDTMAPWEEDAAHEDDASAIESEEAWEDDDEEEYDEAEEEFADEEEYAEDEEDWQAESA